jgi:hypothetical protein
MANTPEKHFSLQRSLPEAPENAASSQTGNPAFLRTRIFFQATRILDQPNRKGNQILTGKVKSPDNRKYAFR